MTVFALNSSCLSLSCSRWSRAYSSASGFCCGFRPRFFGVSPLSSPARRSARHLVRCDEYSPSRRNNSPIAPETPEASAASACSTILSLYSAVKALRFGRSGEVAFSGSPVRTASRTADAVPSLGGEVRLFLDMFDIVTRFLLALDCHFDRGSCLSHVGTEGSECVCASQSWAFLSSVVTI